jgi:hypothetical protein
MGIDTTQADQLVSTCSWYVYQFQKELDGDTEQHDQSVTTETKKHHQSSKGRHKKIRKTKSKKTISQREHSAESATTISSINKGLLNEKEKKRILFFFPRKSCLTWTTTTNT